MTDSTEAALVYRCGAEFLILTQSRTDVGMWVMEPGEIRDCGAEMEAEELGGLLDAALAASRTGIEHPDLSTLNHHFDPILRRVHARTMSQFNAQSALLVVQRRCSVYTLEPNLFRGRGAGFTPIDGARRELELISHGDVGEAVRAAFAVIDSTHEGAR